MGKWNPVPQATKSAPNYVIDQIRDALFSGELKPGDRMPSELELVDMFGVSRGSVRQAMKALESMGLLTIRPGDGTYINTTLSSNSLNPLVFSLLVSRPSAKEFADARYALERDVFELILEDKDRTSKLVESLEENLARHKELVKSKADPKVLAQNDREFHSLISNACDNTLIRKVYDYVMDAFESFLILTTEKQKDSEEEDNATIRDHSFIIEALKKNSYQDIKKATKSSMDTWYNLLSDSE